MTSSHVKLFNLFFIGFLFSTKRTEAGTLHGNVGGERRDDDGPRADISCVLIYEKGRISTEQEARVCLPLQTVFNVSCTLLEEPNTVIDRHRRSVAGSLRTEESNQYIDSSCQWENTDGKQPKCTLLFSGLYYANSGEETISIRANYKNIVKNLDFQIFDPSIAHPFCNPSTTTIISRTTTEPQTSMKMTSKRIIMTTRLKSSDVKIADPPQSRDDGIHGTEDTSGSQGPQMSWQILLPVVAVVVICLVLLVVFLRRRRTNESSRDEYEAVEVELNENG